MFDNLRQQSTESSAYDESTPEADYTSSGSGVTSVFLGLTAPQRFILALMLFLNVTVLGCFALLAFEKIALPF